MQNGKIYLDMDGVLADFDRGVRTLCGMEPPGQMGMNDPEQDRLMWEAIRKVDHFYDRLKLMPGARNMFNEIRSQYGDRCEILTGVPKPERGIVTAGEDKINWIHRVFSPDVQVNIVLRKEKLLFCTGPDTILIDDREDTIRDWEAKGGIGIVHTSAVHTLSELYDRKLLFFNYLRDYGPSQEPVWKRESRGTKLALDLGAITEEDLDD